MSALFEQLFRFVEGQSHCEAYAVLPEPVGLQKMIFKVQNPVGKGQARRPS
jgi:hypothetical protein